MDSVHAGLTGPRSSYSLLSPWVGSSRPVPSIALHAVASGDHDCRRCVAWSFRERQRRAAKASRPVRDGFRGDARSCNRPWIRLRPRAKDHANPQVIGVVDDRMRQRAAPGCGVVRRDATAKIHNLALGYPHIISWMPANTRGAECAQGHLPPGAAGGSCQAFATVFGNAWNYPKSGISALQRNAQGVPSVLAGQAAVRPLSVGGAFAPTRGFHGAIETIRQIELTRSRPRPLLHGCGETHAKSRARH
jgi:hypothetical protein